MSKSVLSHSVSTLFSAAIRANKIQNNIKKCKYKIIITKYKINPQTKKITCAWIFLAQIDPVLGFVKALNILQALLYVFSLHSIKTFAVYAQQLKLAGKGDTFAYAHIPCCHLRNMMAMIMTQSPDWT